MRSCSCSLSSLSSATSPAKERSAPDRVSSLSVCATKRHGKGPQPTIALRQKQQRGRHQARYCNGREPEVADDCPFAWKAKAEPTANGLSLIAQSNRHAMLGKRARSSVARVVPTVAHPLSSLFARSYGHSGGDSASRSGAATRSANSSTRSSRPGRPYSRLTRKPSQPASTYSTSRSTTHSGGPAIA